MSHFLQAEPRDRCSIEPYTRFAEVIMNSKDKNPQSTQSPEQRAAEYVDQLTDRSPTTEQSARENTGWTRRPDVSRSDDDYTGVSDTIQAVPPDQRKHHSYDPSHRGDREIQGEDVATSGNAKERRNEETHL